MFIAVEGPDGAGKTTLVQLLEGRLRAAGHDVVTVREPGGTPVAEGARRLVLDPEHRMDAPAELFLMLAARADLVSKVIRPALAAGSVVLADRFALSTIAYQAHGRGLPEVDVARAIDLATGGLRPTLTIVLDVAPETARARLAHGNPLDRMEREDDEFRARVATAFRSAVGPGLVHVDADGPAALVGEAAWATVSAGFTESHS